MAVKHQDVVILVLFSVLLWTVCAKDWLADMGVRGHFSVCTVAEKWALNPNNYIVSGKKKNQHF